MSKRNKKSSKPQKSGSGVKKSYSVKPKQSTPQPDYTGYLAVMPGLLMCAMTVIILLLDIAMPSMAERQYEVFPGLFTVLDYTATACGLLCIAVLAKRKELSFAKTDFLFAAFVFLILLSTVINGFTPEALNGIPYRNIGIFNMLVFMLVYMGVSRMMIRESFRERILLVYLAAADAVGLSVLIDLYVTAIPAYREKKELSAIFFNGNHYGYFLLMAAVIGIGWYMYGDRKKALFGTASAALNFLILALNHSMGCILAVLSVTAGMSICVLVCDRDKIKKIATLTGALVICIGAAVILSGSIRNEISSLCTDIAALLSGNPDSAMGHNRLLLWDITLGYIKERPFTGSGCEGIAFRLYEATGRSNPHNELLTYAAYYGIPAAICYTAGVIGVFIHYLRKRQKASASSRIACMAAAGYFISSFFGVAMFYTIPFFFIFLGMTGTQKLR